MGERRPAAGQLDEEVEGKDQERPPPPVAPGDKGPEKGGEQTGVQQLHRDGKRLAEDLESCPAHRPAPLFKKRRCAFTKSRYLYLEIGSRSPLVRVSSVLLYPST